MMTSRRRALGAVVAMLCLSGCFTMPQSGGSSAGYVGDRASLALDEVIVSVPAPEATSYRNLHVSLSAIINPRQVSLYDTSDIASMIRRLQTRIEARLVEMLVGVGPIGPSDLASVRTRLSQEAQTVVDTALTEWKHADEYEVTVVVVSLYFTDGSVGRQPVRERMWW